MMNVTLRACGTIALMMMISQGCGSDNFAVAPAKGIVKYSGSPVGSGSITFVPISEVEGKPAGKPAKAELKEDGTFVLSTYDQFDGAVIGRHKVIYESPEEDEHEEAEPAGDGETEAPAKKPSQKNGSKPKRLQVKDGTEVEVKTGSENSFDIELVERPAGQSEEEE
jgi:hypothetical protein